MNNSLRTKSVALPISPIAPPKPQPLWHHSRPTWRPQPAPAACRRTRRHGGCRHTHKNETSPGRPGRFRLTDAIAPPPGRRRPTAKSLYADFATLNEARRPRPKREARNCSGRVEALLTNCTCCRFPAFRFARHRAVTAEHPLRCEPGSKEVAGWRRCRSRSSRRGHRGRRTAFGAVSYPGLITNAA